MRSLGSLTDVDLAGDGGGDQGSTAFGQQCDVVFSRLLELLKSPEFLMEEFNDLTLFAQRWASESNSFHYVGVQVWLTATLFHFCPQPLSRREKKAVEVLRVNFG